MLNERTIDILEKSDIIKLSDGEGYFPSSKIML